MTMESTPASRRPHRLTPALTVCVLLLSFPLFAAAPAPQAVRQWLEKARFFYEGGNLNAARAQLEQARAVAPDHPEVLELLKRLEAARTKRVEEALRAARFYQEANNLPEADKAYSAILAIDPANTTARKALDALQKVRDAVEKYRETGIQVAPSSGRAFDVEAYSAVSSLLRAQAAFNRGDLETADKLVGAIVERDPSHSQALELQSRIRQLRHINGLFTSLDQEFGVGDYFAAVTALDGLLKEFPDRHDLQVKRGIALQKLGRHAEAIRDLEPLLATTTWLAQILPALSSAYEAAGNPLRASALAAGTDVSGPVCPWHHRMVLVWKAYPVSGSLLLFGGLCCIAALGWLLFQIDRLIERFSPQSTLRLFHCFLFAFFRGLDDRHSDDWKSLAFRFRLPWISYVYGLLLFRQGDLPAAQEPLQKALESPSLAPRALYFLGILRKQLGQSIANHDLEQSLLAALRGSNAPLIPPFLSEIEHELIDRHTPAEMPRHGSIEDLSHQAARELFAGRPVSGSAG
ncbi:MAG TPA: tetratricopeptide repeat protein [Candidatus Ozemobacteraceae bacterium]